MADYRRDYDYPGRHDGYRVWMPRERGGYWRQYEDRAPFDQKRAEDVPPVSQRLPKLQASQPQAIPRKSTPP